MLALWVGRLVRIPSVSPAHAGPRAGAPGEKEIGRAVAGWFREFGGEVTVEEVTPGRPNIYGVWPGSGGPAAALDVHLDTVGVEQMTGDPFSGELCEGRVWGRGAVDTKASLGVALALLQAMHRQGLRPSGELILLATMDEEDGGTGAGAAAEWLLTRGSLPAEMVVAEPTGCTPMVAHRGVLRVEWEIRGEAAHTSRPRGARNAIHAAGSLIGALTREAARLAALPEAKPARLGSGDLSVTLVEGGRGSNIVPDLCRVVIDRRLGAGETSSGVGAELNRLAEAACPLPIEMRIMKALEPFERRPEDPWPRRAAELTGCAPDSVPFGTNAFRYGGLGGGLVVLGPGSIKQAHGPEEWVELAELERLARFYSRWWNPS